MPRPTTQKAPAPLVESRGRDALIALVEGSPRAVAAKDEEAWLALFAPGGVVEDPVGTPPCRKDPVATGGAVDDLTRFYRCFIAPNAIRFEVHRDTVGGRTVARDVTLHVTSTIGAVTEVPAHLFYTVTERHGPLQIERLEAYWQASTVTKQTMAQGLRGKLSMLLSPARIVATFGPRHTKTYIDGTRYGIRREGREMVATFADAASAGDLAGIDELFDPGARIVTNDGEPESAEEWLGSLDEGAVVAVDKLLSSGWATSANVRIEEGKRVRRGAAVFAFRRDTKEIGHVRLYLEED